MPQLRALLVLLRRERFTGGESSTPGGRALSGFERELDLAYARGWNARSRSLEAWLQQGSVDAGLVELVQVTGGEG